MLIFITCNYYYNSVKKIIVFSYLLQNQSNLSQFSKQSSNHKAFTSITGVYLVKNIYMISFILFVKFALSFNQLFINVTFLFFFLLCSTKHTHIRFGRFSNFKSTFLVRIAHLALRRSKAHSIWFLADLNPLNATVAVI